MRNKFLKWVIGMIVVFVIIYCLLIAKLLICNQGCNKYTCDPTPDCEGCCPRETCKDHCNMIYLPNFRDNSGPLAGPIYPPHYFLFTVLTWPILNIF